MIGDLIGDSKTDGDARSRDMIEEYKSRMWGESLANNHTNFQACAVRDLMGCQGLGGGVTRRSKGIVGQDGYDRGLGWPSTLWGG